MLPLFALDDNTGGEQAGDGQNPLAQVRRSVGLGSLRRDTGLDKGLLALPTATGESLYLPKFRLNL